MSNPDSCCKWKEDTHRSPKMEGGAQSQLSIKQLPYDELSKLAASKTPQELVIAYKGRDYPAMLCSVPTFEALENVFQPRPDDAMLVAYPKCVLNWALQLMKNMASIVNKDVGAYNEIAIPVLEFGKPEKFQTMKESPSPRVYGTHLYYDDIPKSFFVNKTKMLVVFRNPKDTAVSYFHFWNKNALLPTFNSWDEFFAKFMSGEVMWGSYFEHAVTWNKHMDDANVLVMTFEQLKEDLAVGFKKITEFFGYSFTEDQIQSVVEGGSFNAMKEKFKTINAAFAGVLFRKGEVGDWKNWFSEAQSKEMDAKFEACLAGTKLAKKLKYDVYCSY